MPSSSSGSTAHENLLRSQYDTIQVHLSHYNAISSAYIGYKFNPIISNVESELISSITCFFARTLDIPMSASSASRHSFYLDRQHIEDVYGNKENFHRLLNEIQRLDPTPVVLLQSLTKWLETVAGHLDTMGRTTEADQARDLAYSVKGWALEVEVADEMLENEERIMREGMAGVCLRWGV